MKRTEDQIHLKYIIPMGFQRGGVEGQITLYRKEMEWGEYCVETKTTMERLF